MVRFSLAILEGGLLKPKTVAMHRTTQHLESGEATGSGLGWHVRSVSIGEDSTPSRLIGHPGSSVGGTTSFMTFPEKRMIVAIMSNVSFAEGVSLFAVRLANLFGQAP